MSLPARKRRWHPPLATAFQLLAVDVEVEVLVVDFLVSAIGENGGQRLVKGRDQILVL